MGASLITFGANAVSQARMQRIASHVRRLVYSTFRRHTRR
jgi:hypothetical protein